MKTLCFAVLAGALLLCNGCALLWLGDGGDDAQGSSSSAGPTSSSSSGSGTGGGDGGTCTPTNWVDAGAEASGCGMPPSDACDLAALPACSEEACTGSCKFYDKCTSTGWFAVAFCDGAKLVSTADMPDAGPCTPPDLDTTGATTGCGALQSGQCPESDAMCVETACDGSCKFYDKCTTTGWFSVAFCDGSKLIKM